jgi:hypothetical protein
LTSLYFDAVSPGVSEFNIRRWSRSSCNATKWKVLEVRAYQAKRMTPVFRGQRLCWI